MYADEKDEGDPNAGLPNNQIGVYEDDAPSFMLDDPDGPDGDDD